MEKRRSFIKKSMALGSGMLFKFNSFAKPSSQVLTRPVVVSTWDFGVKANEEAWKVLSAGGKAIDAVEQGVKVIEADPKEKTVGYGGRPDRTGRVTLDACIMDEAFNIGSVACLEHIKHPISVARAVMEKTTHVMLAGEGALDFALQVGFKKEDLLTPETKKEYLEWKKNPTFNPIVNIENHDTIGMVAVDSSGRLSGACTTSGMAYKLRGRVGDSPIIGAGLYVDNEVGAVTASGHGEEVIRVVGAHLVIELMRQGMSPFQACREAVKRIDHKFKVRGKDSTNTQIGFIALANNGAYGAFALRKGFTYAIKTPIETQLMKSEYLLD